MVATVLEAAPRRAEVELVMVTGVEPRVGTIRVEVAGAKWINDGAEVSKINGNIECNLSTTSSLIAEPSSRIL